MSAIKLNISSDKLLVNLFERFTIQFWFECHAYGVFFIKFSFNSLFNVLFKLNYITTDVMPNR